VFQWYTKCTIHRSLGLLLVALPCVCFPTSFFINKILFPFLCMTHLPTHFSLSVCSACELNLSFSTMNCLRAVHWRIMRREYRINWNMLFKLTQFCSLYPIASPSTYATTGALDGIESRKWISKAEEDHMHVRSKIIIRIPSIPCKSKLFPLCSTGSNYSFFAFSIILSLHDGLFKKFKGRWIQQTGASLARRTELKVRDESMIVNCFLYLAYPGNYT
jgi:hypothetical protein